MPCNAGQVKISSTAAPCAAPTMVGVKVLQYYTAPGSRCKEVCTEVCMQQGMTCFSSHNVQQETARGTFLQDLVCDSSEHSFACTKVKKWNHTQVTLSQGLASLDLVYQLGLKLAIEAGRRKQGCVCDAQALCQRWPGSHLKRRQVQCDSRIALPARKNKQS